MYQWIKHIQNIFIIKIKKMCYERYKNIKIIKGIRELAKLKAREDKQL